jgi:hypothetical protein
LPARFDKGPDGRWRNVVADNVESRGEEMPRKCPAHDAEADLPHRSLAAATRPHCIHASVLSAAHYAT